MIFSDKLIKQNEEAFKEYWGETKEEHMDLSKIELSEPEMVLPEGVLDGESYLIFLKARKKFIGDPSNPYPTSLGIDLDLKTSTYFLKAKIKELPYKEQVVIKKMGAVYDQIKGHMAAAKRKAYRAPVMNLTQVSILDAKKAELTTLFGKFYSTSDIHKILTTQYGYEIELGTLTRWRERNIKEILIKQEEYKKDYNNIRLTHKKSRLEELNFLYQNRKEIYMRGLNREDYKLLLQTIKDIKGEVEGDLVIKGDIHINMDIVLEAQVRNELIKSLALKDIIIARVAARSNINPAYLMSRLHSSIYSKFSGFEKPDFDITEEEPMYPSKIVYNFDDIRTIAEERRFEKIELQKLPKVSDEEEDTYGQIKDFLINKIKEKQQGVKEGINYFEEKKEGDGDKAK